MVEGSSKMDLSLILVLPNRLKSGRAAQRLLPLTHPSRRKRYHWEIWFLETRPAHLYLAGAANGRLRRSARQPVGSSE